MNLYLYETIVINQEIECGFDIRRATIKMNVSTFNEINRTLLVSKRAPVFHPTETLYKAVTEYLSFL
jgi:hypothetical protein